MKPDSKQPVASLLTTEQITANEDEEVYILKVPNTLSSSSILTLDMNIKSPNTRVFVQDKEFSPLLTKLGEKKTLVGQNDKNKYSPAVVELKGIITLRESVKVPPVPIVEIPPAYKVPHPQNLVTRHPIYGKVGLEPNILKRKHEDEIDVKREEVNDIEAVPSKKKKKKKDKEAEIVPEKELKIENNNVPETKDENGIEPAKKKKKKDKVKETQEEAVDIKEEEDIICDNNKSKKKKKHKNKSKD